MNSFQELLADYVPSIEPLPLESDVVFKNFNKEDVDLCIESIFRIEDEKDLTYTHNQERIIIPSTLLSKKNKNVEEKYRSSLFQEDYFSYARNSSSVDNFEAPLNVARKSQGQTRDIEKQTTGTELKGSNEKMESAKKQLKTLVYGDLNCFDVLLMRGQVANNHSGNVYYREQILKFKKEYDASDKHRKTYLSWQIVFHIKSQGGKFYVQDQVEEYGRPTFVEVSDLVCRRKVSQAFRDMNRRQKISPTKKHI